MNLNPNDTTCDEYLQRCVGHKASVSSKHQHQGAEVGHDTSTIIYIKTYILVVHVHDSIELFEPRLMLVMIGTAMLLRRRCRCLNSPCSSSTIFSGITSLLGEKSTLGILISYNSSTDKSFRTDWYTNWDLQRSSINLACMGYFIQMISKCYVFLTCEVCESLVIPTLIFNNC